jgi:hypothetical protein
MPPACCRLIDVGIATKATPKFARESGGEPDARDLLQSHILDCYPALP